jgi:signal transduction histidine kinase
MTTTNARVQVSPDRDDAALTALVRLQELFESVLPASIVVELPLDQALERARLAVASAQGAAAQERAAVDALAVEMLATVRLDLATDLRSARLLVDKLDEQFGVHRSLLVREMLRDAELLSLPPMAAVSAQLSLLAILAHLEEVSLWSRNGDGKLHRIARCPQDEPSEDLEEAKLARSLLARRRSNGNVGDWVGLRVERWGHAVAALVGRGERTYRGHSGALLHEAAPVLAAILERDQLLTQRSEIEEALVEAKDRQITRLGLDLHDGPLQDVAALASELRLFRMQLAQALRDHEHAGLITGRIDDLEAQLVAVDAELRRLAVSLQSPFLLHHDFVRAVHETAEAFHAAAGIEPDLELGGELDAISESQQLALLAILREALNNVREHAEAKRVTLRLFVDPAGVHVELSDDGKGFDVEETLLRAAQGGHVGLVGMQERVRMLSGHSHIDSRPGGPTTISLTMPQWQPAQGPDAPA